MKTLAFPVLASVVALCATACSGSGGTSVAGVTPATPVTQPTTGYPLAPPPGTTTAPSSIATATFSIHVPAQASAPGTSSAFRAPAASRRHAQYVSSGTQSIKIAMTSLNGTSYSAITPLAMNLLPGAPGCVTQTADAGLVCSVTFPSLPVGVDGFTLTTYDKAVGNNPGAADALSTNTVTGNILVGQTTSIPVTLAGIISSLTVSLENTPFPTNALTSGTAQSGLPILVTANDASGAQIIGSFPYQNVSNVTDSIKVSTDDALGTINLNSATLTNPSSTDAFSYSGVALADATDHITVTDSLNPAITASAPVRVKAITNSERETLAIVGTPIDASTEISGHTFDFGSFAIGGPYSLTAGSDTSIALTAAQPGWGTATHPFVESQTCTGLNVTLTNNGTSIAIAGQSTQVAQPACTVTISGGGGQTDIINFTLTGSSNGANIQVQSAARKR